MASLLRKVALEVGLSWARRPGLPGAPAARAGALVCPAAANKVLGVTTSSAQAGQPWIQERGFAMKFYNPTTPGQRHKVTVRRDHLWKGKPFRALTKGKRSTGGKALFVLNSSAQTKGRLAPRRED